MKTIILFVLSILVISSCKEKKTNQEIQTYLGSFDIEPKAYKVILFVPADGCTKCIYPSIDFYSRSKDSTLLVLSSTFDKSINLILKTKNLDSSKILCDSKNLAATMNLVDVVSPYIYLLKKGRVRKIFDLSKVNDQSKIFIEVDKHLQ